MVYIKILAILGFLANVALGILCLIHYFCCPSYFGILILIANCLIWPTLWFCIFPAFKQGQVMVVEQEQKIK